MLRSLLRQFLKKENGTAAVEMAFIFPMFILFVVAMIEFGRAYWTWNSMQRAIDEAGRYAMVHITASDSQIVSTARANLSGLNPNSFTVTSVSTVSSGITYKTITATYPFDFVAPGVLPYGSFTLTRSTRVPQLP
jgi:Flp pilus assembly protein TadG